MTITNPIFLTSLHYGFPFLGYFAGIVIRKLALNKRGSPALWRQLLLGIPLSLVTVSPVLSIFQAVLNADAGGISAYLISLGAIIGAGMALPEAVMKHLKRWIDQASSTAKTAGNAVSAD
jgi:hypothetical protein